MLGLLITFLLPVAHAQTVPADFIEIMDQIVPETTAIPPTPESVASLQDRAQKAVHYHQLVQHESVRTGWEGVLSFQERNTLIDIVPSAATEARLEAAAKPAEGVAYIELDNEERKAAQRISELHDFFENHTRPLARALGYGSHEFLTPEAMIHIIREFPNVEQHGIALRDPSMLEELAKVPGSIQAFDHSPRAQAILAKISLGQTREKAAEILKKVADKFPNNGFVVEADSPMHKQIMRAFRVLRDRENEAIAKARWLEARAIRLGQLADEGSGELYSNGWRKYVFKSPKALEPQIRERIRISNQTVKRAVGGLAAFGSAATLIEMGIRAHESRTTARTARVIRP